MRTMVMPARRRLSATLAVAVVSAGALAACSSSGGSSAPPSSSGTATAGTGTAGTGTAGTGTAGTGTGASAAPSGSPAAGSGLTAAQIAWAVKYTGGKAGAADQSLAPVTVGYVNQEGGTLSFPEATVAASATVKFINEQLGGIDGHPLKLDPCLAASTADVEGCGTQMANDSAVNSIVVPLLLLNNQAFYSAIGGKKPIIDGSLIFPIDLTTPNVYSFTAGGSAVLAGPAIFATKVLHATKVAIIRTDNPAGLAASQVEAEALKAAGATVTANVAVPEPGPAPQYTQAISAAGIQSGQTVELSLTAIGQSTVYDALQSLGLKVNVLSGELALLPPMPGHLESLGLKDTVFPDSWYMEDNGYSAAMPTANSGGADVYLAMMAKYAVSPPSLYGYAPTAFEAIMEMAKFITQAGGPSATSAKIAQDIKAYRGPAIMAAGSANCGAVKQAPNECVFDVGYEQRVNGQWVSVDDGINGKPVDTLTGTP